MTTKKYLKELQEGTGHLNPYSKKLNTDSPDYGGYIKIEDKIYRISAWINNKKISIKATEADYKGFVIYNFKTNQL